MNKHSAFLIKQNEQRISQPLKKTSQNSPNQSSNTFVHLGNAGIQRLLAQRSSGDGAFNLDDAPASRINSARGGGRHLTHQSRPRWTSRLGRL